jgi:cytochrome c oxidase subunit 2
MLRLTLQSLGLAVALVVAPQLARAEDDGRGRELFQPCTACHGQQGEGNRAVQAPAVAGLPEWYVAQQLRNFRNGRRGGMETDIYGAQMARMAEQLWDDGEVTRVATYIAALPPAAGEATVRGKASRGKETFTTCAACHGADAEGNEAVGAPPLRTLDDWYVVNQLTAFRSGVRGTHPEDVTGQQMRAAAAVLGDEEAVSDVATYLGALRKAAGRDTKNRR